MPIFTGLSRPKTNRCFNVKIQDTDLSPLLLSKKVRKFIIVVAVKKLPEYLLLHYKDPYVSYRCRKIQLSRSDSFRDLDARLNSVEKQKRKEEKKNNLQNKSETV